ncbi:MAG: hypothetical protein AB7K52_15065 [Phycisphaerales bacterium]
MLPIVVYDDGAGELSPLTDLRAAFDVRTGALTTLERLERVMGTRVAGLRVPAALAGVTRERHPGVPVNAPIGAGGRVLLCNGRAPLLTREALEELERRGGRLVRGTGGSTAAPQPPHSAHPHALIVEAGEIDRVLSQAPGAGGHTMTFPGASALPGLLTRPWHVRACRDACLDADLALLGAAIESVPPPGGWEGVGSVHIRGHDLDVHRSARVFPGVVLDCEAGPIVIDEYAVIRPAATIIGPAYVGPHSTVLDRAIIKGHTAVGPWCKVAGEVGGTIFQGFANKAHDGHLGDSWIGEWVNLGAGTTNSNLLNTYGEVTCRALVGGAPGPNERTGEQFLGAIIGDHVKTAISTRIMTGAIVGTGVMWAATGPLTGTVEPFSWVTDRAGGGATPRRFAPEKFEAVMRAAMSRRKVTPSAAYLSRLHEVMKDEGGGAGASAGTAR